MLSPSTLSRIATLVLLITVAAASACTHPQRAARSPAAVAAPAPVVPDPPRVCYSRDDTPGGLSGDTEISEDPGRSVFVLDREMLPELARRLDHPSDLQKKSSLDKSIVQMVIRRHVTEVTDCVQPLVAKTPDRTGTVTVRFLLDAEGRVTRAHVTESTLADADTEDCIGRSLCGWRFPGLAAGRTLVIDYPFMLGAR